MLSFDNHPPDLLIEVASHLGLLDVFSFLSVCSSFWKLRESRYLWIALLERTQRLRSLACRVGTDVSQLDIDHLQYVARWTHRVEKNWRQSRPCIARAIRSVPFISASEMEPAAILAVIPATPLVILYAQQAQRIIVCDSQGRTPVSGIHVGKISRLAHFNERGRHLIALTIGTHVDNEMSLRVVSVEYGDGNVPAMRTVYQGPIPRPCRALFIYKDVVGIIPYSYDDSPACIHAINFVTRLSVNISVELGDSINNTSYIFCSIVDGTPFIITAQDRMHHIYRCPIEVLPLDEDTAIEDGATIQGNLVQIAALHAVDPEDTFYDYETPDLKWSPRGLHAFFVLYNISSQVIETHPCFWPIDHTYPPSPDQVQRLATMSFEGTVAAYFESRTSPWLVATSQSGTYAAVVVNREVGPNALPTLFLIEYDSDPLKIESRQLELPFFINLDQIYAIAIDESLGVIYLSHALGHLFAVPYA
ncbi:hypothetical protein Hypma_004821 [Hypsizygus marmoreus]|uniref:F-box domain-containing protein n=1 Tax=Hypsizygus marmoreus TaxID=39966 RepID=A0A369J1D2_HYPMA|nr:hypothetical protein Hypma_004821 [Hypsizygus marmoreus]